MREWSSGAQALTGLRRDEVVGKRCDTLRFKDASGDPICSEPCEIARLALAGVPDVDRQIECPVGEGQRPLLMFSIGASCQGQSVIMHIFQPRPGGSEQERASLLTPRQLDVLRQMDGGLTTKQIAAELGISAHTVTNHVQAILRSLGVSSRVAALHRARQLGLL